MTTAADHLDEVERRTIAAIKGLRSMQSVPVPEICSLLHISKATWYLRLQDGQFTVREVSRLAARFGVTVQDIIDGRAYFKEGGQQGNSANPPTDAITKPVTQPGSRQYLTRNLSIVPGEGDKSPSIGKLRLVS